MAEAVGQALGKVVALHVAQVSDCRNQRRPQHLHTSTVTAHDA